MIDEFAKAYRHHELRVLREAKVWKLDGLSDYDDLRPITATGTNLLGLVKPMRHRMPGTPARSSVGIPPDWYRGATTRAPGRTNSGPPSMTRAPTSWIPTGLLASTRTRRSTRYPSRRLDMCLPGHGQT